MYNLNLSESLVPAQTDDVVREITVGGLLREVAGSGKIQKFVLRDKYLAGDYGQQKGCQA